MVKSLLPIVFVLVVFGCSPGKEEPALFTKMSPNHTGISFENTIQGVDYEWFSNSPYIYNGGGVALGDLNNNGLPDLFLGGNLVSSRLYLNQGDFRFEDITETAGVLTERWIAGVSMVDINQNGYLDIYLSVSGEPGDEPHERANKLFINNGDLTFTEAAADYGIDYTGYTTHAVFLDYNGNGYMDLFLMNNSPVTFFDRGGASPFHVPDDPLSYDTLFRNNGDGTFTDVSEAAGILRSAGYGLGVVVADFNRNGWPDIYVSNDSVPNDVLYINNGDGTFTNKLGPYLTQTSLSGMGVDAADFTNNGWPDIIQCDMKPEDILEQKKMSGGNTFERFRNQRSFGLDYYYPKNTLQLNHGMDREGNILFSDISRIAGTAYTDWTWAALFADYNNNGYKDIMVANGYPKNAINHQYMYSLEAAPLGSWDARKEYRSNLFNELRPIHLPNYFFENKGDMIFEDVSYEWGFREPGFSYGAAHGDLNNDGNLDLVINNINSAASVYKNNSARDTGHHFLQIRLEGEYPNRQGLGADLTLYTGDTFQYIYHTIYRGYQSTMDGRIHFGMGEHAVADSLEVIWPDGRKQVLSNIEADQILQIRQSEADRFVENRPGLIDFSEHVFIPLNQESGMDYHHQEKRFVDFNVQPTLPYMKSRIGPPLAVGDVSGNGLDDLYIGGITGHAGVLYLQNEDGTFAKTDRRQPWEFDEEFEDTDAVFFDANGNGRLDLYVGSGGYHATRGSEMLQDRLYLNMGEGRFLKDEEALPRMLTNTSVVVPGDFTGDGRMGLFVGGGMVPGNYPDPAGSFLLGNEQGRFVDVTGQVAPELAESGIISDALWFDYNNNGRADLVTAGIWEPIRIYENNGTRLREVTSRAGLSGTRGWWYSLAKGDFNGDGSMDLIAGNLGLNHTFTTSEEQKFGMVAADFSNNMTTDIVFTVEQNGREVPFFSRARLSRAIPGIMEDYPSFRAFANASLLDIFSTEQLNTARHYKADIFSSMLIIQDGNGSFRLQELPREAQTSPLKSMVVVDLDGRGYPDIIAGGNIYESHPDIPRSDAGNGIWLRNDGKGNLQPSSPYESGLLASLDVRDLAIIKTANGKAVVVANNDGPLEIFLIH